MNWNKDLLSSGDPIIELMRSYNEDSNPEKVNLGVGVFQDETGATPIFSAVKKAENYIIDNEITKSYIGVGGDQEYLKELGETLFENNIEKTAGIQTVGGSGALRVIAETCRKISPEAKVWLSNPTWANHFALFEAAKIKCQEYMYYDIDTGTVVVNFEESLKNAIEGDYVLIHATCHNPTGLDLTVEQKNQLIEVINSKNLVPIFDAAYLGFNNCFQDDCIALLDFIKHFDTAFLAFSASKNIGLYRERVGAAFLHSSSHEKLEIWKSLALVSARTSYSMPPAHGAEVVKIILKNKSIKQNWLSELENARERVNSLRKNLAISLSGKVPFNTDFIQNGKGLFCLLPLNKSQIDILRDDYSIYMLNNGRVNVAGLSINNLDFVANAIISVGSSNHDKRSD